MNTDTYFTIGKSHKICQDYALEGSDYVIVCDGCSSAPQTDFGARLLAKAAEASLSRGSLDSKGFHASTWTAAESFARTINLPADSLLSTLLVAKAELDHFSILMYGDGAFAFRNRQTKQWTISVIEFASGAPFYIQYEFSDKKLGYIEKFGTATSKSDYGIGFGPLWHSVTELKSDNPYFTCQLNRNEHDCVAIMSDGVSSFQEIIETDTSRTPQKVPIIKLASELLTFKNTKGEFVNRRANKAFKKFDELGWKNFDDVSIGAIIDE